MPASLFSRHREQCPKLHCAPFDAWRHTINTVPAFNKLSEGRDEAILEPDLSIIDAYQHLFDRPHLRYLLDDYLDDANAGHHIIGSVYIETRAFARAAGPETLRPVGEVEFANGVAAMAASGVYGPCRVAAAIVGFADMRLGDRAAATMDASMAAAPERFRGVRQLALSHPDPAVLRFLTHPPPADLLSSSSFRAAYRHLGPRGLVFDATVLHHQLPALAQLADAFPDTTMTLGHAGLATAIHVGPEGKQAIFDDWRQNLLDLARRPNVVCKISGLGTSYWGFGFHERTDAIGYRELAAAWKPYVETAIEAFGPERCMMGSNYPNDGRSCGFVPLWNSLKYTVQSCAMQDKAALFHGTAARIYRIALP